MREKSSAKIKTNETECKGAFFRAVVTQWLGWLEKVKLEVNQRERLRFLKSKSCPGCAHCDGLINGLENHDGGKLWEGDLMNGRMYELCITEVEADEEGAVNNWRTAFVLVDEKDEP